MDPRKALSIDEYVAAFPLETQSLLTQMREIIRNAAPEATERISYGMPAFFQDGDLVYFAPGKNYLGFYPTGLGVTTFESELARYEHTKGAVHLPLDEPLPAELISRIVRSRVEQNAQKAAEKAAAKRARK
jgi:uncharacterized protein YdhG (YjbR/CyaY superfamily)